MNKFINFIEKVDIRSSFWFTLAVIGIFFYLASLVILKYYSFYDSKIMKNIAKEKKDSFYITFTGLYILVVYKLELGLTFKELIDFYFDNSVLILLIIIEVFQLSSLSKKEILLTTLAYENVTCCFLIPAAFFMAITTLNTNTEDIIYLRIFCNFSFNPICIIFSLFTFNFAILFIIIVLRSRFLKHAD